MSNISNAVFANQTNKTSSNQQAQNTQAQEPQTLKRVLCIQIEGSLNELARMGTDGGLWKAHDKMGCSLFHPNLEENLNQEQNTTIVNSLRNAIIKKVTIKEQQSSFPFILGVNISCIPPNEVTSIGEKFAYTVLPNSSNNNPQVIHQCDPSVHDNSNWNQLYAQWNNSNLEKEGVMDVPNQPFLFVHMNHPVIGLLRYNQNLIGCDIDTQPKLEREYLKVSKQVMATCCDTIRTDILNKMKTKDISSLTVQVMPLNSRPWDDYDQSTHLGMKIPIGLSPEEYEQHRVELIKEYVTTPYQYIARMEVKYELPTKT